MKIDTSEFRVKPGKKIKLKDMPTKIDPICGSDAAYKEVLEEHVHRLAKLHELLYGADTYAVLVVFQGMDTAGKDGAIKHVMSGVDPQGCEVTSFKQPSAEELQHDFLWRAVGRLPRRGSIGIFNRSYYEEVLVVQVHPELLANESLVAQARKHDDFWEERYQSIRDLEMHLHRNNTRMVKIFLHLSKQEQQKRFLARIDDPDKNWKFNMNDVQERGFWKKYQQAYEACLRATSTDHAPWYVVPADDKENARLIVSQIIVDTLAGLKMSLPRVTEERRRALLQIRRALTDNDAAGKRKAAASKA